MRNILATLVLLPATLMWGCGGGDGDSPAQPAELGREFVIRYGETIQVGELRLQFSEVLEESRCPINANCVWAGNARIVVTANRGNVTRLLELNTSEPFPTSAVFDGHFIFLRDLHPYPVTPATTPLPQGYTATLLVDGQVLPAGG